MPMTLEEALSRVELCVKLNLSLDGPQQRYAVRMLVQEIQKRTTLDVRREIVDEPT